jgi:curved DNA-binding protein CbpA/cell division septation protein DedD
MDMSNDYYAILGVLPSAEHAVIKAAWRALSMMYHPDRYEGDVNYANERMRLINEAAEILLDSDLRSKYDQNRNHEAKSHYKEDEQAYQEAESSDKFESPQWKMAVEHFPDLEDIVKHLNRTSKVLGCSFKSTVLETKQFSNRYELAVQLEQSFIESYFGKNETLQRFARFLIQNGNRTAAKYLNESINVIGKNIDPLKLIDQVCKKFNINYETRNHQDKDSKGLSNLHRLSFAVVLVFIILALIYQEAPEAPLSNQTHPIAESNPVNGAVGESTTSQAQTLPDEKNSSITLTRIDNVGASNTSKIQPIKEEIDFNWALHIASFKDERNAKSLVSDLNRAGFSAYYDKQNGLIRTYIGPGTRAELEDLKFKIREKYSLDGMVIRVTEEPHTN